MSKPITTTPAAIAPPIRGQLTGGAAAGGTTGGASGGATAGGAGGAGAGGAGGAGASAGAAGGATRPITAKWVKWDMLTVMQFVPGSQVQVHSTHFPSASS